MKQSTVPDFNCYRPVAAIAVPVKTDTSVDNAFLGGGVCAIQPSSRMRVALVFRHARGGHFSACSTIKAVPRCNECRVAFVYLTNLWK